MAVPAIASLLTPIQISALRGQEEVSFDEMSKICQHVAEMTASRIVLAKSKLSQTTERKSVDIMLCTAHKFTHFHISTFFFASGWRDCHEEAHCIWAGPWRRNALVYPNRR